MYPLPAFPEKMEEKDLIRSQSALCGHEKQSKGRAGRRDLVFEWKLFLMLHSTGIISVFKLSQMNNLYGEMNTAQSQWYLYRV